MRSRRYLADCQRIATHFGRTGKLFVGTCRNRPDILCLGKALTGGTMTLARSPRATLRKPSVTAKPVAFMHGPTFMGNPRRLRGSKRQPGDSRIWRLAATGGGYPSTAARALAPPVMPQMVADVRVLGAIGVVETTRPVNMAALQKFFVEQGVWIRLLANRFT
ncbi:aminotransferase class III-fold pyridoxal phosphate-dependent enzyme [Escherichia coli]